MSKQVKTCLMAIITALVIGGGLWLYYSLRQASSGSESPLPTGGEENMNQQPTTSPETLTSDTDVSDGAIDQDMQTIDAQLNGLTTDVGNVDQSVKDNQDQGSQAEAGGIENNTEE